jgi:Domain of unknown function (DUF4331)
VFDLGGLRPLNSHYLIPLANAAGVNSLDSKSVHAIAIRVPISKLASNQTAPTSPTDPAAMLGFWTTASRQTVKRLNAGEGTAAASDPYVQVPVGQPTGQRGRNAG